MSIPDIFYYAQNKYHDDDLLLFNFHCRSAGQVKRFLVQSGYNLDDYIIMKNELLKEKPQPGSIHQVNSHTLRAGLLPIKTYTPDLDITNLDSILDFAMAHGITKRQIGIVCYGESWRSIYKQKAQDPRIIKRNKRIADAIHKILEDKNA